MFLRSEASKSTALSEKRTLQSSRETFRAILN